MQAETLSARNLSMFLILFLIFDLILDFQIPCILISILFPPLTRFLCFFILLFFCFCHLTSGFTLPIRNISDISSEHHQHLIFYFPYLEFPLIFPNFFSFFYSFIIPFTAACLRRIDHFRQIVIYLFSVYIRFTTRQLNVSYQDFIRNLSILFHKFK